MARERDELLALPPRGILSVDAAAERDIEVVAHGALLAELAGVDLVARTAASFVRARAGRESVRPLASEQIQAGQPGLIVVGSHVPSTTASRCRICRIASSRRTCGAQFGTDSAAS